MLSVKLKTRVKDLGSVGCYSLDFMFVYHGYECLINPRLCKAVHCCLAVSRAMASCSCFQLSCSVASIDMVFLELKCTSILLWHSSNPVGSWKSEVRSPKSEVESPKSLLGYCTVLHDLSDINHFARSCRVSFPSLSARKSYHSVPKHCCKKTWEH